MTKNCERCGAMINYAPGVTTAKCDFCHAEYPVDAAPLPTASPYWTPPPAASPYSPTPYVPAPQPVPMLPQRHVVRPTSGGGGARVALFVAVCGLAGAGAVFARLQSGGFLAVPPPTLGTFAPDPTTGGSVDRTGTVSGDSAANRRQNGCRGYVTRAPQMILNLRSPSSVQFAVQSPTDTTLVVRRPDGGYLCDDDSGGATNPLINSTLQPGLYTVWVGTYSQNATAAFSIHVDATPPIVGVLPTGVAPDSTPALGTLDLDSTPSDARPGVIQARVDLSRAYPQCRGFGPVAPTLTFHTSEPRDLVLTTRSSADLTMLIRDEQGAVRCDDDGGESQNPLIRGNFAPGTYQVWIGIFRQIAQTVPFTLDVRTDAPAVRGKR